jgi:hypothetical protein
MALSADLILRYTTQADVDWRHAFVLTHATMADPVYLIDDTQLFEGIVDGHVREFQPVPMDLRLPSRDNDGRQDLTVTWCGIADPAKTFLDTAITDGLSPISCRHTIFILGNQNPQIDPWIEYYFSQVSITREAVSATASRADILNRKFPTQMYRFSRFPGLRRQ